MMVNVIAEGEYSTDTQTQHREAFKQLGDDLSALLKDYEMVQRVGIKTISPHVKTVTVRLTLAMHRLSRISFENPEDITNCEKPLSSSFGSTEIESNSCCRAITLQCVYCRPWMGVRVR